MKLFNPLDKDIKGIVWNGKVIDVPSKGYSKNLDLEACKFVQRIFNVLSIVEDESAPVSEVKVLKEVNDVPEVEPVKEPEVKEEEPVKELDDLNKEYEIRFGKKLVGKWAKDMAWLKSKLNK